MLRPLAGLCLLLTVLAVGAETPLQRIDGLLAATDTLKARFEQTVFDEKLRRLEDSRGMVYIRRPGRFRWDYQAPTPQLIVADGASVWMLDHELEQVTVRSIDGALGNTPALLLSRTGGLGDSFAVSEQGRLRGLDWYELKPRSVDATFERLRLGLAGEEIRIMEMLDNFGQLTELRFSEIERNTVLADELFTFEPPAGVDVIDDR